MKKKYSIDRIFIVEDDPIYIRLVKYVFELNPAHEIHIFKTGKECLANLYLRPAIVSLDYMLSDISGEEVLEGIKNYDKDIEVIVLSGQKDIDIAVHLLKSGAYDYIVKNDQTKERLKNVIFQLKNKVELKKEVENLKDQLVNKYNFDKNIIGDSKPMQGVLKLLKKAIQTNISVSIFGETGSGKEVIARSIHYNSNRSKGNFVAVNVSAIPKELLESELFGHEKGSFTGADTQKIGKFELADKGTLFLDEIAEMDVNLQSKLLRALQEREVTRIGGNENIPFDTRVIIATHRKLTEEVAAGRFREDLYYRLLGLPIELPPLRERGNDILLLMRHFLQSFCNDNKLGKLKISKTAKDKLLSYSFPGNVRELKAIIELAAVMAENGEIQEEDIRFNSPRKMEAFLSKEISLKEYNSKIVHHFLDKYNQDVLLVADKLGIGKSTIYRMLKEESKV